MFNQTFDEWGLFLETEALFKNSFLNPPSFCLQIKISHSIKGSKLAGFIFQVFVYFEGEQAKFKTAKGNTGFEALQSFAELHLEQVRTALCSPVLSVVWFKLSFLSEIGKRKQQHALWISVRGHSKTISIRHVRFRPAKLVLIYPHFLKRTCSLELCTAV